MEADLKARAEEAKLAVALKKQWHEKMRVSRAEIRDIEGSSVP